ncbi:putative disease resistance protein At3g14460 [Salvia splendens]|uniref:putative disease resistance protein At3g14460 n=1 Tax=Salvia splendens TaxID=180675 RepID=UPI001C2802CA|nr:putative disease resistance protein At3g14460 [Salvia splendens]
MGFDTVCITKSIIESASGENCILSYLDPLQLKLQELIRDKRFLLVLDDYWSEEYRDWDILSSPSRVGAFVHSHCVETLSEDNSWELLKQRATSGRNLTSEFERIGREIAIKCKGLPLAAKTDHDFEVSELVFLWIAEGFVHPTRNMGIEDLGYDYFKNLLQRSFFQLSGVNVRGGEVYKMHDLIHSMAQQPRVLEGYLWYENLRTLKVMSLCGGSIEVSYLLFLKLKSLRVLDLSRTGLVELPESIENLKYLHYLNLSENAGFTRLPRNMKKMVSLQYLHMDLKQLNEMPSELGKLVNLQSLSAFIVGRTEGHGIQELNNMKFLRGCLSIKNLDNVPTVDEAKKAMLHTKPFLDRLEFEWNGCGDSNHHEQILHGLQPHENLKELLLTNYNGFSLPGYLKSLTIDDMPNWSQVNQDFSGFQSLEYLAMKNIPNLVSWCMFRGSRFPRLHTLHINDCLMLITLPLLVDASRFHSLEINQCPEIRSLPHDGLPGSLAVVTISDSGLLTDRCRVQEGADWHMIRSVPKIVIDEAANF